jgi:hypothetical protein
MRGPMSAETTVPAPKPPLYWRALRLRHLRPNGWQRAILVEGVLALALILVLADVATAWTLLVLPLASAVLVKGHDVLAGLLPSDTGTAPPPERVTAPADARSATSRLRAGPSRTSGLPPGSGG